MATATFYTFSKRKNSTLQPTGSGTQIDVNLKSGTSLISPTFLLNISGRPTYNYVSFEGRYYFITDIISVRNDLWEIQCTVDALASWKTEIGTTEAVILYATGGSNDIIDQRIGVKSPISVHNDSQLLTGDFGGFTDSTEGIAIVSITGSGSFGNFLVSAIDTAFLLSNTSIWNMSGITDVATGFQQFLTGGGNQAGQNLRSAIYLPIILTSTSNFDAAIQLWLGGYPCTKSGGGPLQGMRVHNPFLNASCSVSIPWQFTDWRRNAPYSKVFLYLPLVGVVSLPSQDLINESSLSVLYTINMLGGDVAIQVKGGNSGRKITTASCNIAMQSPYGSANVSGMKITGAVGVGVGAVAAVAAGVVTGGAAAVALGGGLASSASGLLSAMGGETAGGGGLNGSAVTGLDKAVVCSVVSRQLTDTQANLNPIIGKPVMAKHTIGTYSGFVHTDGMSISGNMTETERETINGAFNGGAYYE